MENQFLDTATRTVLAMASALLLHLSENLNRYQDVPRAARPMTDSYIDQMAASRTIHFSDSEPSQRSASQQQRSLPEDSYADLYHSGTIHLSDDSVQQSSVDQSQPEESHHMIPRREPAPRRRTPGNLPNRRFSPGIEHNGHLPGFYRPDEPIIAPIRLPRSAFPNRNQSGAGRREIDTSRYRLSSTPLRSPELFVPPRRIMGEVSNLDSESFPDESMSADASQLEQTINTIFNRINRQIEILQAGRQPTDRIRFGIVRQNSVGYRYRSPEGHE